RHTRSKRDWSSDVCSSDLRLRSRRNSGEMCHMQQAPETFFNRADFVPDLREQFEPRPLGPNRFLLVAIPVEKPEQHPALVPAIRSEERRVGKECRPWRTTV